MKKIVLVALSASLLLATNGDNLTGLGVKSRAMGGIGIATYFGAENTLTNPALMSKSKKTEFDFGAILFMPTIKANGTKSKADVSLMPEVSLSQHVNENISFGLGMYGAAGMGVDFRNSGDSTLLEARTALMLMKFAPSIAYHKDNFSVGFAPVVQYGSLDIAYKLTAALGGNRIGNGSSDNFGFGFETGLTYDVNKNFTVGLVYKSKISMTYKDTLSVASGPFVPGFFPAKFSDNLDQPAEYGLGLSYKINNINLSFDYKKIKWGSAAGYKDFGWTDQNVYAVGAKYEKEGTWYAIGYNHAKNPITNYNVTAPGKEAALNLFNYLMFPATSEDHISIGAGTTITKNLSINFNAIYSPNKIVNTKVVNVLNPAVVSDLKVEHQETSAQISMKYMF
jgi:long-chain fatty acid transport protein